MPFSTDTASAAGRRGGSRRSNAQAKALEVLHASRRGVRVHPEGDQSRVLSAVAEAVRRPVRGIRSVRVLAAHLGVSDRTVRRWLSGEDWPPAEALARMRAWIDLVTF